jgi:hypothetical protein
MIPQGIHVAENATFWPVQTVDEFVRFVSRLQNLSAEPPRTYNGNGLVQQISAHCRAWLMLCDAHLSSIREI